MGEYVSIGRLEPGYCLTLNHAHIIIWRGESVEMAQSIAKAFNDHNDEQQQTIEVQAQRIEHLKDREAFLTQRLIERTDERDQLRAELATLKGAL